MAVSEIGIEPYGPQRTARDRKNIAAVRRTLRRNPNSCCHRDAVYPTLQVRQFDHVDHTRESQNFNRDLIDLRLCRGTTQRSVTSYYQNIKYISFQNNASIIIAYSLDFIFLIFFLKHGIDHSWTPCRYQIYHHMTLIIWYWKQPGWRKVKLVWN